MAKNPESLVGLKFGRLMVIEFSRKNSHGTYYWLCKCDCGDTKIVQGGHLKSGNVKSCGCYALEISSKVHLKKSGMASFNALYNSYKSQAILRKFIFEINKELFQKITSSNCYYCGIEPSQIKKYAKNNNGYYIYNGIDRVDPLKGYTLDNVVPCCKNCNRAKLVMSKEEFISWVKRVYNHLIENKIE